jgi:hypothetical protein
MSPETLFRENVVAKTKPNRAVTVGLRHEFARDAIAREQIPHR